MIKTDTIIRTIILFLALVNQILISTGHNIIPVSDEEISTVVSTAITIGASVWAWWKNNSFTAEAIKADEMLEEMRNADK